MYKIIKLISILIINNFIITNLVSCEKDRPSSPAHITGTRFATPVLVEAPSIASLITEIIELRIALNVERRQREELQGVLSNEMHKQERLKATIHQQQALRARKYTADISQLQDRVRALEKR